MRQSLKDLIANIRIKAELARQKEEEKRVREEQIAYTLRVKNMRAKDKQRHMHKEFLSLLAVDTEDSRKRLAALISESWELYVSSRYGARINTGNRRPIITQEDRLTMIKTIASNFYGVHPEPYRVIHHRNFGTI